MKDFLSIPLAVEKPIRYGRNIGRQQQATLKVQIATKVSQGVCEKTQKIVLSNTPDKVEWENAKLIKDNIADVIQKLKQQPGKNIVVAGRPTFAQLLQDWG
jgi:dihydrofolate reductase